jgi:hypothetical protein
MPPLYLAAMLVFEDCGFRFGELRSAESDNSALSGFVTRLANAGSRDKDALLGERTL